MEIEEVMEGVLYLLKRESLYFDGAGHLYISIKEFLEKNGIDESVLMENGLPKLKEILQEMEQKRFLEERHFFEENNGRVDYKINSEGGRWLNQRRDNGIRVDEKWKIPDGIVRFKDEEVQDGDIRHPFKRQGL
ncbi:MAG: hypothetical protein ABEI74_04325 [Candidatus Pacearchaeota archaeon]